MRPPPQNATPCIPVDLTAGPLPILHTTTIYLHTIIYYVIVYVCVKSAVITPRRANTRITSVHKIYYVSIYVCVPLFMH